MNNITARTSLLLLLVATFSSIGAQTPNATKNRNCECNKRIKCGVTLNHKAVSLPVPEYPAEAKAVNAAGSVIIRVLVDEDGKVYCASACSGHPLLRRHAEQAAYAAVLQPTLLSGKKIKISGTLAYNFSRP